MERSKILEEVAEILCGELPEGYRAVLFGSWARGEAHERADLDIGIVGPAPVDWSTYLSIRRKVEEIRTLRKIDVVDLMRVGEAFRERALAEGKPLSEAYELV